MHATDTPTGSGRPAGDPERLAAFEHRMAMPIFLAAVLPIVLTGAGSDAVVANVVIAASWVVFIVDLVVHVRLRPGYLRTGQGIFDLAVVVLTAPWFLIPGLEELDIFTLARLARLGRVVAASRGTVLRLVRQLGQVGLVTTLLVITCAYVAYGAERSVNEEFGSFSDALWWGVVTITTVGYGDIAPVTTTGRVTATVLMVAGLAVLGVLAGALASFFGLDRGADDEPERGNDGPPPDATPPPAQLTAEVAALRRQVADLDRMLSSMEDRLG